LPQSIGFYREGKRGFYSIHPLSKFLSFLLYIFSVFQVSRWDLLSVLFIVFCFGASNVSLIINILKKVGLLFAPILIALLFIHVFFHPYHQIDIHFSQFPDLSTDGLKYALLIWFRFICAGSYAFLFLTTTKISALTSALEQARMPRILSYIILNAITLLPDLQKRISRIQESQQARGMKLKGSLTNRSRALLSLIKPLIYGELEQLDERALALEIKGFRNNQRSTVYKSEKLKIRDYIIIFASLFGFCIITGIHIWL
jgi:energy-coupling factor transport system permease protein